jgi:hypothetical protein
METTLDLEMGPPGIRSGECLNALGQSVEEVVAIDG